MQKKMIEKQWREEKYHVMFHSQQYYNAIRLAMREEQPAQDIELLIEQALATPPTIGSMRNASQHMWGYFKKYATEEEKAHYTTFIDTNDFPSLLSFLHSLAHKYDVVYLINSRVLHKKNDLS